MAVDRQIARAMIVRAHRTLNTLNIWLAEVEQQRRAPPRLVFKVRENALVERPRTRRAVEYVAMIRR